MKQSRWLILLLVFLRSCEVAQPIQVKTVQTYTYFLPGIAKSARTILAGNGLVALYGIGASLVELKADWCYHYQYTYAPFPDGCLSKQVFFTVPDTCTNILLLGNEPNNSGEGGYATSPQDAANGSKLVRQKCPNTTIVAPNVAGNLANAEQWLADYFANGGIADQLGFHVYSLGNSDWAINRINQIRAPYKMPICLLEWGDPVSVGEFQKYSAWIKTNIKCNAVWVDHWEGHPENDLFSDTWGLTLRGAIYRGQ